MPLLMLLFARVQRYYTAVGRRTRASGRSRRRRPRTGPGLVIVPVGEVSRLTQHALTAALALGDEVVAVARARRPGRARALRETWDRWDPGCGWTSSTARTARWCSPIVGYVRRAAADGRQVAVLIPEVEPRHRRYRILQNQRGILLATVLRARTDVVVCMLPYRLGR